MDETGTPKVCRAVTPRQLAAEAVERLEISDPRGRRRDIAKRSLVLQEETKGATGVSSQVAFATTTALVAP